jgi:hypothetical protein
MSMAAGEILKKSLPLAKPDDFHSQKVIAEGYSRVTMQRSWLAPSSRADRIGWCFRRPILP